MSTRVGDPAERLVPARALSEERGGVLQAGLVELSPGTRAISVIDPDGFVITIAQSFGSGLGLAISRWIAEAPGARITVVSDPRTGSTFSLWLPVEPADLTGPAT